MERFLTFLPSMLIITSIAGATFIYLRWIVKRFGDDFKSVEWHQKNELKVVLLVGIPYTNIWAPTIEELIFRAPIIIVFSAMSSSAWYGVLASSVLYSLSHWFGNKICMPEILSERESGNQRSDNLEKETERLYQKLGKITLVKKVANVVLTFPLGILAGYCGIVHQSIWVSVGIHSVWNFIMPVAVQFLIIVAMGCTLALSFLWGKVRCSQRR